MGQFATAIPEKIFFKIGEVCDLVGVQAHVLRYWETEFSMLSPQKNRSGQRSYRRRDVEIALRIKELLYDDLFTIAGAKKKLQTELRDMNRLKIVHSETAKENFIREVKIPEPPISQEFIEDDVLDDAVELEILEEPEMVTRTYTSPQISDAILVDSEINEERREALTSLAAQLLELREMLKTVKPVPLDSRARKY